MTKETVNVAHLASCLEVLVRTLSRPAVVEASTSRARTSVESVTTLQQEVSRAPRLSLSGTAAGGGGPASVGLGGAWTVPEGATGMMMGSRARLYLLLLTALSASERLTPCAEKGDIAIQVGNVTARAGKAR